MAIFDGILQLYTLYYCIQTHHTDGKEPVLPRSWALIIDIVTTFEPPWASSRIISHILSHDLLLSR